jgi:hypothetical protein
MGTSQRTYQPNSSAVTSNINRVKAVGSSSGKSTLKTHQALWQDEAPWHKRLAKKRH